MANVKKRTQATSATTDTAQQGAETAASSGRSTSNYEVKSSFGKSPAAVKTFNSSAHNVDDRLGFVNRDSLVTERTRQPMVINPMGRDYWAAMRNYAYPQGANATAPPKSDAAFASGSATVPGVMSLDIEFTPAAFDSSGNNITTDIFLSKWIASRYLDNMVKNWQQGDIAAVETSLMMIRAYVEHARRCLRVMRDVYQDSANLYYSPTAMMHALGFYMPEHAIRTQYEAYWRYFNNSIVGLLNACKWISGCPGHMRWASLFCEVYKDNPAKTRYTQMFVFRPHTMYQLKTEEDGWHLSTKTLFQEYFNIDALNPITAAQNPQGFWKFLHDLNSLIRQTFYDDSVQDMLATMNAIDMRSSRQDTALGTIARLEFEPMEFESRDFDFPLTFDMQMLVAIHNATICNGFQHSDITIDPTTGDIKEMFWGTSAPASGFTRIATLPKAINMPTYTPTLADMFNATQWTVTAYPGNYCNQPASPTDGNGFRVGTFGTDVIVEARIHYRNVNVAAPNAPTDPAAFTSSVFLQTFEIPIERDYTRADMIGAVNRLSLAMQFAFAPTIYSIDNNEENGWCARGILTQSEIYFIGDTMTLSGLHRQFLLNFWGYPMFPGAEGSPDFSVLSTESNPL